MMDPGLANCPEKTIALRRVRPNLHRILLQLGDWVVHMEKPA